MIDGVINIYKDAGYTSHDVVAKLRGIFHQKKIGHTGTLDPQASGVLPVCLGKATKLCDMMTDWKKTYEAVMRLGVTTDTQDMTGKILSSAEVSVTEEAFREAAESFRGDQMQIPPMFSALKVNGRKLYELAREGIEVERKPRPVHFYEIEITRMELPLVWLRIVCSKGTYIRTLCHDIEQKLGCGAAMEHLVRTNVGSFRIEDSFTLREIERHMREEEPEKFLIPVDEMFMDLPWVKCPEELDLLLHNGNPLNGGRMGAVPAGRFRIYDSRGEFVGVYEKRRGNRCFPVKMFY